MTADHGDVHHHAVRPPALSDTHPTSISNPNTLGTPTIEVSALDTSKHSCNTTISNFTAEPQDSENLRPTDEQDQGPSPSPKNALLESFTALLEYLTLTHKDLPPKTRETLISEFHHIRLISTMVGNKKASNRASVHRIPQAHNNSQENNNIPESKNIHEDTETPLPKAAAQEAKAEPEPEAETESETESEATEDTNSKAMLVDNPSNTDTDENSGEAASTFSFTQISKPKKKKNKKKKIQPAQNKSQLVHTHAAEEKKASDYYKQHPQKLAVARAYCANLNKEMRKKELPVE
jgi:hypothetical protein